MRNMMKVLATAALLAAIIPASVYAADTVSPTTTAPSTGKENHFIGKVGFGGMMIKKQISQDLLTKLKLDEKTFQDKLAKGETLAQIAQDQGLSRDDLKAELTAEFNKALDKQKADFAANLDSMVDGKGKIGFGGKGEGDFGQFGEKRMSMKLDLSGIAQLLGLNNVDLKTALSSGKSFADLATEKGVPVQKLIDAQVAALLKGSDQDLKDGKITQADYDKRKVEFTNMATKMINDKHVNGKGGNFKNFKKENEKNGTPEANEQPGD